MTPAAPHVAQAGIARIQDLQVFGHMTAENMLVGCHTRGERDRSAALRLPWAGRRTCASAAGQEMLSVVGLVDRAQEAAAG